MTTLDTINGISIDDEMFFIHQIDDMEDSLSEKLSLTHCDFVYFY